MLKDYLQENNLGCLSTIYQKRSGQQWTHTAPNGYKAQLDYIIINRKWRNSAKNCRAYNSFVSAASDHRIVSTQIRLSLRANKKISSNVAPYDWSTLKINPKIHETFVIQLNNRFASLQESVSAPSVNSTSDNFETVCRETAKNTIPLKPKTKKRKPWESADICQKRHELHTVAQLNTLHNAEQQSSRAAEQQSR